MIQWSFSTEKYKTFNSNSLDSALESKCMEWSKITQFWRAIYITQVFQPRCTIITPLLLENSVVIAWLTLQANDGGRLFAPEPACPSQDRMYQQQGTLQQGPGHSYHPTQLKCSECRPCNHYTAETTSSMRPFQKLKIETFWTESKVNFFFQNEFVWEQNYPCGSLCFGENKEICRNHCRTRYSLRREKN